MKQSLVLIIIIFCLPLINLAQEFGCYDIRPDNSKNYAIDAPRNYHAINWGNYSLDSSVSDSFYTSYCFDKSICSERINMQGNVVNGKQEGFWKLYMSPFSYYSGNFVHGKKEGLWIGYTINWENDTIVFARIMFKNNVFNGKSEKYSYDGKIDQSIDYVDGLKDGKEINYRFDENYSNDSIYKYKEYTKGQLNGKYIEYIYGNIKYTVVYGTYLHGKRNGRFNFKNDKLIVDYVDGKVEGKVYQYYDNGILFYEMEYKNDMPYQLLQMNDTNGKPIQTSVFKDGTGTLAFYYQNGQLMSSCEYKNQLLAGKLIRYNEDGEIVEEGYIYADTSYYLKYKTYFESVDDKNLYSAWQQKFIQGTHIVSYNYRDSTNSIYYAQYKDSLNDLVLINKTYKKETLLSEDQYFRKSNLKVEKRYFNNGNIERILMYSKIDTNGEKVYVKDGFMRYYHTNGQLQAEVPYYRGNEIGTSYYYDEMGEIRRTKVNNPDGSVYNVLEGDTVNCTDSLGRKQGKWLDFTDGYLDSTNKIFPSNINYYKDNQPIGKWEYYDMDGKLINKISWKDSVNAYSISWDEEGLIEEGYLFNFQKVGKWKEYDYSEKNSLFVGNYECGNKVGKWYQYNKRGKLVKTIDIEKENAKWEKNMKKPMQKKTNKILLKNGKLFERKKE